MGKRAIPPRIEAGLRPHLCLRPVPLRSARRRAPMCEGYTHSCSSRGKRASTGGNLGNGL